MKITPNSLVRFAVAAIALGVCQGAPGQAAKSTLQLRWDSTAALRSGPLAGYSDIVRTAAPSVVAVLIQAQADPAGAVEALIFEPTDRTPLGDFETHAIGSGVILTTDGYVITSSHVVEPAVAIRVVVSGLDQPLEARLVGMDPLTDIAVLKVDAKNLPAATLAKDPQLAVGDVALTIGNPFGLEHTVTAGIISGLGRKNLVGNAFENFIQTDAPINPGSSGGALIDNRGRVIGITGAMVAEEGHNSGIAFAEPIGSAVEVAHTLILQGEIRRGSIGVEFCALSERLAEAFGTPSAAGALISDIRPGSPAETAGLVPGDVVVTFEKNPIKDPRQLELLIAECEPDAVRTLELIRFGEKITAQVKVERLSPRPRSEGGAALQPSEDTAIAGAKIADLDSGSRIYFAVPPEIAGVIVIEVEPGSPASAAGITEGDVILQIGRDPVASLGQAIAACEKTSGDKLLLRILGWEGIKFVLVENN